MSEFAQPPQEDHEVTPEEQREIIGTETLNGYLLDGFEEHEDYAQFMAFEEEKPDNRLSFAITSGDGEVGALRPLERYELSEHDKEIIKTGTTRLADYLGGSQDLPTTIFFPDTAARPLFWAILEPIRKIYKENGTPFPKVIFLKTDAHTIEKGVAENLDPELVSVERELWESKVAALKDKGIINSKSNVLVVDDYVSASYRNYNVIGSSIKKEVASGGFTWFSFLADPDTEEQRDMIIAKKERQTRPLPKFVRTGLDYASTVIQRANVTGVDKYTAALPTKQNPDQGSTNSRVLRSGTEVNRDIVTDFRKSLKEIGKDVADQIE